MTTLTEKSNSKLRKLRAWTAIPTSTAWISQRTRCAHCWESGTLLLKPSLMSRLLMDISWDCSALVSLRRDKAKSKPPAMLKTLRLNKSERLWWATWLKKCKNPLLESSLSNCKPYLLILIALRKRLEKRSRKKPHQSSPSRMWLSGRSRLSRNLNSISQNWWKCIPRDQRIRRKPLKP